MSIVEFPWIFRTISNAENISGSRKIGRKQGRSTLEFKDLFPIVRTNFQF